jgi:hypothetical protein
VVASGYQDALRFGRAISDHRIDVAPPHRGCGIIPWSAADRLRLPDKPVPAADHAFVAPRCSSTHGRLVVHLDAAPGAFKVDGARFEAALK